MLLCGASARSMETDSLSLFESGTYKIGNVKKLLNWGVRAGFQGGKMYLGKQLLFANPWYYYRTAAGIQPDGWNYPRFAAYKGGGALLFLHGLKGFLKECGYESPGKLFKYLEGRN